MAPACIFSVSFKPLLGRPFLTDPIFKNIYLAVNKKIPYYADEVGVHYRRGVCVCV